MREGSLYVDILCSGLLKRNNPCETKAINIDPAEHFKFYFAYFVGFLMPCFDNEECRFSAF